MTRRRYARMFSGVLFWICLFTTAGSTTDAQAATFNYAEALQKSLYFYDAQRSGHLPERGKAPGQNRVEWRGDAFLGDGGTLLRTDGSVMTDESNSPVEVDLSGGFFDAGDHVKFGLPFAAAVTMLAWGGLEFEDGYVAAQQWEYLLSILTWAAQYIIAAHPMPNVYVVQVGDGNIDHSFWGAAEIVNTDRPLLVCDPDRPGTEPAAEAAAALAAIAMVFERAGGEAAAYARDADLLGHARQLFAFADTYRGSYSDSHPSVSSFYKSWNGYTDELAWAAAWLYRATGEQTYLDKAETNMNALGLYHTSSTHSWDDKSYGTMILLAQLTDKQSYHDGVQRFLDTWAGGSGAVQMSPGGLAFVSQWGSLRYASSAAFCALVYSATSDISSSLASKYTTFATRQIDYILGDNPRQSSYMVGFGNNPPRNPHHRTAHGSWTGGSPDALPKISRHILYGALVGGPKSTDDSDWEDDRGDYIGNEVALDYNAGLTGALARLVSTNGGQPLADFPAQETRDAEFGVEAKVNVEGTDFIELAVRIENRTAWLARQTPNLLFRFFVDLSDEIATGLDPSTVTVEAGGYNQGGIISPQLKTWDASKGIYAAEISLAGQTMAPANHETYRREVQFRIHLPEGQTLRTVNDWSLIGLSQTFSETDRIPVYEGASLAAGLEPDHNTTCAAVIDLDTPSVLTFPCP
ncbi:glycoside hydrolase family 9 protein [Desulfovibrio inopinatus]|uniref:glycoside hydrolase family 9 protein n=1 Tax=Desulfovibrio inopinatus TaxID=102109 RepID=UPI00068738B0|nr:glycoside hydrolase family 9 protein [Desulfovibrio inopinatus]